MPAFLRCLQEYRAYWRVWLPLLVLTAMLPVLAAALPLVEKRLIDEVILAKRPDLLVPTAVTYAGLWLLSSLIQVAGSILRAYFGEKLSIRFRQRILSQAEALSIAFARREHSSQTTALFLNDVPVLVTLFNTTVLVGFGSVVALVVGLVAMLGLNWQLAVAAGIIPPLIMGLASLVTRALRSASRRVQDKVGELNERLQESLAGIREVVAFGQESMQERRLTRTLTELLRLRMRVALLDTSIQSGQTLVSLAVVLVIVGYGGYLVILGQATLGTLVAMQALFSLVFLPAGQLVSLVGNVQKALASADRLYAFLDQEPQVREQAAPRALPAVQGWVAFEGVSFGYEAGRLVLDGITFSAEPGAVTALVGPSGAGKSTLVSLIPRFYDPLGGRVLLDGIDLRELSLSDLRSQIGIVFQDTYLFSATIRENIAFGCPRPTDRAIEEAAQAANALEFIERLPNGFETQVGERGARLSEGQRQRLAIARAFIRNPRILILDEPTSALDARSERLLKDALDKLFLERTVFVIAHRLDTIARADRILVVEGGRIRQEGTHATLLQSPGLYREFFGLQFGQASLSAGEDRIGAVPSFVE